MKGPFRFLIGCYFLLFNSEYELSTWEMHCMAGTGQTGNARLKAHTQDGQASGCLIKSTSRGLSSAAQCRLNVIQK